MFQLTYKLTETDDFLHQISQFGAHFVSKGPEVETYYQAPNHQLRIDHGISVELVLIKIASHYQILEKIDIPQQEQFKKILNDLMPERMKLTSQVIRYYLKNILIEIRGYDKLPQLLFLQGEKLEDCRNIVRQLSLPESNRIIKTPADMLD